MVSMMASSLADFSFGVTMEKQDAEQINDRSLALSTKAEIEKQNGKRFCLLRGATIFFILGDEGRNPRISSVATDGRERERERERDNRFNRRP
jgi:hypothetical protein